MILGTVGVILVNQPYSIIDVGFGYNDSKKQKNVLQAKKNLKSDIFVVKISIIWYRSLKSEMDARFGLKMSRNMLKLCYRKKNSKI